MEKFWINWTKSNILDPNNHKTSNNLGGMVNYVLNKKDKACVDMKINYNISC